MHALSLCMDDPSARAIRTDRTENSDRQQSVEINSDQQHKTNNNQDEPNPNRAVRRRQRKSPRSDEWCFSTSSPKQRRGRQGTRPHCSCNHFLFRPDSFFALVLVRMLMLYGSRGTYPLIMSSPLLLVVFLIFLFCLSALFYSCALCQNTTKQNQRSFSFGISETMLYTWKSRTKRRRNEQRYSKSQQSGFAGKP